MRAEELVASQDTIKLLNNNGSLELFKETLPSPILVQIRDNKRRSCPRGAYCAQQITRYITRQIDIHGLQ